MIPGRMVSGMGMGLPGIYVSLQCDELRTILRAKADRLGALVEEVNVKIAKVTDELPKRFDVEEGDADPLLGSQYGGKQDPVTRYRAYKAQQRALTEGRALVLFLAEHLDPKEHYQLHANEINGLLHDTGAYQMLGRAVALADPLFC